MVETLHFKLLFNADICVSSLFIICCWSCWKWSFLFDGKGVCRSGFVTGSVSLIGWAKGLWTSRFITGSRIGEIS